MPNVKSARVAVVIGTCMLGLRGKSELDYSRIIDGKFAPIERCCRRLRSPTLHSCFKFDKDKKSWRAFQPLQLRKAK
jgi:hypothetical protein